MKSDTLAQLLATLGVQRSFSRPHVSDDNAFSEAQFKTLKYQPDYPGRFASELHARGWLQPFFGWHNDEHHHSNLALFTPADVFFGRVEQVRLVRQSALDAAYAAHPERFPNGAPLVPLPPLSVSINPITSSAVTLASAPDQALRRFFATTNAIENVMGTIRRVSRNVKRWRHGAMAKRWAALGLQAAQARFQRIKGHRQMPALVEALKRRAAAVVDREEALA
jgi:hypothetical protein